MSKVISEDSVRGSFSKLDEAKGTDWLQRHLHHVYAPLVCEPAGQGECSNSPLSFAIWGAAFAETYGALELEADQEPSPAGLPPQ